MTVKQVLQPMVLLAGLAWIAPVVGEILDGADILKREERRAQELKDIEYQTQLLERKARLARMYRELQAHGGFVPDLEFMRMQERLEGDKPERTTIPNASAPETVPVLRRIEGRHAHFETNSGTVITGVGATLPGGYRVRSISMQTGVELEKSGVIYRTDVTWN